MASVLRLEDARMLADPAPVPEPPPAVRGRKAPAVAPPLPPPSLIALLGDGEARVRRRAALAVGRVGLSEGVEPLVALLADSDPEVRQVAAFALGVVGEERARAPLVTALNDRSLLVRGSAAEALGLLGGRTSADAIAAVAADVLASGALASTPGDEADGDRDSATALFRLSLFALARVRATDQILRTLLDPTGQPRSRWWPVAYALGTTEDPRVRPALRTLTSDAHPYTRAFAIRALAAAKDRDVVRLLMPLVGGADRFMAFEAVRAVGRIGDPSATPALAALLRTTKDTALRAEALQAIGLTGGTGLSEMMLDWTTDPVPAVRMAAFDALARVDREQLLAVLSGLDPDPDWTVRAALADVLGTLPPEVGQAKLATMLHDQDKRVVAAVLTAIGRLGLPDLASTMLAHIGSDDVSVRTVAARALGTLKPASAPAALAAAFGHGRADPTPAARLAVVDALAAFGAIAAAPVLREALQDKDWAVRVRASSWLARLEPSNAARGDIRPAPVRHEPAFYGQPARVNPPVSVQAYIDTNIGSIQLELAMLDAPLAVESFIALARAKHFDGVPIARVVSNQELLAGDVRGDGSGGPGYTVRDEVAQRPVLRGTVGLVLAEPETGGSQFFVALSPMPERDSRGTVIGRVVGGMEVADQIQRGDTIRHVRIWDGQTMQ